MKLKRLLLCSPAVLLLAMAACPRAYGDISIFWGGEVGVSGIASDGTTAWDSSYHIELGWFDNGFLPTADNLELWADSWKPVDSTTWATLTPPYEGYFSESIVLADNLTAPAGQQAFMWVRDSATPGKGTEWLLASNDAWLFPDTTGSNQTTPPLFWDLIAIPKEHNVPFGGIGDGTDSQGGEWTLPPGGTFGYQTHKRDIPVTVPENTRSLTLALPAALALALASRRRRSRSA